ncbi:MAG TPA: hypothetical protein VKB09_05510 [Thermomicrobiales bacterium]|nr:hypothetical protein [Thermomicrobiales bacterium]
MARYLVLHTPTSPDDAGIRKASDMLGLAKEAGAEDASPRWLKTWSPDLHDDRIFTLWEAEDAAQIQSALTKFGFLDHMDVQALRVQEWGPADVLAAGIDE